MVRRENLHPDAVEKPRCIGRDVGRLIGPVVEVVVAEEPDVGKKYSCIHVDPMQHIKVISTVSLRKIAIRAYKIPLAVARTRVVSRRRGRVHSKLSHKPGTYIVIVKISPHAELLEVHFARTKEFAGAADGMIDRMIEVDHVVHVGPNLGRE